MALIKLDRIISVSSEDPNYSAENLLKNDYSDKKWKSKNVGEKQISVVIQFEKPSVINSIDVGNYGSAFIEILVGKSSNPDDFKVLVVTSSLMSLQESKLGTNITGVRFFKEDSLSNTVDKEKWDRIKIVCSQPYNKYSQYGLSFIIFRTNEASSIGSKVPSLGKFQLKPTNNDSVQIKPGSFFARRNELESKGAAAIRLASVSAMSNGTIPSECKLKQTNKEDSQGKVSSVLPSPSRSKENKTPKRNGINSSSVKRNNVQNKRKKSPSKKPEVLNKKKRLEKPFSQLLEDVVFTISGFENPYRSNIRNKALEMGAKYRRDWDGTCTHLLCAFPNTPKFKQVLGKGKIVSKEWFEACYSRRMKLPWRSYSLHPADKTKPESDEEVFESVVRSPSPPADSEHQSSSSHSTGEDTEDEIERVKEAQLKKKNKNIPLLNRKEKKKEDNASGQQSLSSNNKMSVVGSVAGPSKESVFDADTDLEEDVGPSRSPIPSHLYLPTLPSVFENISFFIDHSLPDDERKRLKRYIIANNGSIIEDLDADVGVEYIISDTAKSVNKLKETFPDVIGLKPEWVWRAHDEGRLIPSSAYEL